MFVAKQQIGPYTLISRIGRGSFGEVWLADRHTKFATTQVAVKFPLDDQVDLLAVEQEARLWAQASGHPNILPIIEANEYNGQIVIVSEYAADGSLEQFLRQYGSALPLKQAIDIAMGVLSGLEFLHSKQIIHRDVKPGNILLQGGIPRLADFSISRAMQATSMSANIAGTPKYMAPEAFDGKRNEQTDIWSIGVILYQMLKGDLPFPQQQSGELLAAIIMRDPEPMPNSLPEDLRDIVIKALDKNVSRRYQTAAGMLKDLSDFLNSLVQPSQITFISSTPSEETVVSPNVRLYPHRKGYLFGFCDANGRIVIDPQYDFVYPFSEGLASVKANTSRKTTSGRQFVPKYRHGVIDKTGNVVIPIEHDLINRFIDGLAMVSRISNYNMYFGFINKNGDYVIPVKYGSASLFSDGLIAVRLNHKYGFVDKNDRIIISLMYEDANPFSEGLAAVKLHDKWGFIDKPDNVVIPFQYDSVFSFSEGLAAVSRNGKHGFIDKTGSEVIPLKYDLVGTFHNGIAAAELDNGKFYIGKDGTEYYEP